MDLEIVQEKFFVWLILTDCAIVATYLKKEPVRGV